MKHHAANVTRSSVDVGCALATLEAKVDRLVALVEQLVVRPRPPPERAWVTVDEAAALVGRTPAAVRKRCRASKIGHKVDGAWRIDRARLVAQKLRDAKPAGPVP